MSKETAIFEKAMQVAQEKSDASMLDVFGDTWQEIANACFDALEILKRQNNE